MLRHLQENVYCRLAPSSVHGIGVVAMRDIPQGVDPFRRFNDANDAVSARVTNDEMQRARVPEPVKGLIHEFFFAENDHCDRKNKKARIYPITDPNAMNISFYCNHSSKNANVFMGECANHANCSFDHIYTLRPIKAGEELFLDYSACGCPFDDKFSADEEKDRAIEDDG